jgi:hypothetical protein
VLDGKADGHRFAHRDVLDERVAPQGHGHRVSAEE